MHHPKLKDDSHTTVSYVQGLSNDQKLDTVIKRVDQISQKIDRVHALINAAWALTPAQEVGCAKLICPDIC
jgi:hypothetical protein